MIPSAHAIQYCIEDCVVHKSLEFIAPQIEYVKLNFNNIYVDIYLSFKRHPVLEWQGVYNTCIMYILVYFIHNKEEKNILLPICALKGLCQN